MITNGLRQASIIPAASLSLFLLGAGTALNAQEVELQPPQPISTEGLEHPGFGAEGLHKVRFTVNEAGKPTNVEVVGGFTHRMAANMLKETVDSWEFTPGTENGENVEFHNVEYILRSSLSDSLGVSEEVQEALAETTQLIADGDYRRAERRINRTLQRNTQTVMDYALLHETLSDLHIAQENYFAALEASKIATMYRINSRGETEFMLTPEILRPALEQRFRLAILPSLRQYPEAWRTWQLLEANFDVATDAEIRQQAEQVKAALDAPEPLMSIAQITEDSWSYVPERRIFSIADVEGRLRHIDVRCDRRTLKLDYQADVDWTLPAALGRCELDFVGRNGTSFSLYEFNE